MRALPLGTDFKIVSREESLRSRQHRGVCIRVIYECESIEISRTEMEPGSSLETREIGDSPVIHFVIDGSPFFLTSQQSADLMPGDSVMLSEGSHYTISNSSASRSVILSILFKTSDKGAMEIDIAAREARARRI